MQHVRRVHQQDISYQFADAIAEAVHTLLLAALTAADRVMIVDSAYFGG